MTIRQLARQKPNPHLHSYHVSQMSKDTKLLAEQCEMLHKQHMSFLSLPASPALETAFLALVDDHYNAAQDLIKDEMQEEDVVRGGRPRRGELEEAEAQVATSGSQVCGTCGICKWLDNIL